MSNDNNTLSYKIAELEVENNYRNDELTKEILEDLYLNKNLTSRQIAKIYHIGKSTVLRKLHLFGIETRKDKVPPKVKIEKQELKVLYIDQKLSISKIAKKFNVSDMTIHKKLRQAKIQCRDVSEANTRIKKYPFDGDSLRKAYLIGFALGDLNVKKPSENSKIISIKSSTTIQAQIDLVTDLFSKYGKLMIYKGKAGESNMQIFVDMSFSFLLDYKKELEWIIKEKKTFLAFFGGFIDAEGSFFIRKKQQLAVFSLGNYNKAVLLLIKEKMFVFFNIELKFYEETKLRMDRRGYINNDTEKKLLLVRQKKLSKFLKLIAPFILHKNKQKELQILSEFVKEKMRQREMRS